MTMGKAQTTKREVFFSLGAELDLWGKLKRRF